MLRLILVLSVGLSSVAAFAGDASTFHSLGFSENGKYYAFAESGVQDGSGFAYANIAVVEVAKNSFSASRRIVIESVDDTESSTENALAKAIKEIRLSRFGIEAGKNIGQDLLVRLPTDFSDYTRNLFSFENWAEGGASTRVPKYEAIVETKDGIDSTEGQFCSELLGTPPQLLKLSIVGRDATNGAVQVLQEDRVLPKSRNCTAEYGIQRVTTYKGGLVVALIYRELGFEGPNFRHMVVTGQFTPVRE